MSAKHASLIPCCAVLILLPHVGCGVSPELPTVDDPVADAAADPVFPDDADPATAALPSVEDELLVQPLPGADATELNDLFTQLGAIAVDQLSDLDLTVLNVPPDQLAEIAAELAASQLLEGIHKNYVLQAQQSANDPLLALQSHLTQLDVAGAWRLSTGSQLITIAIVDSGVQADHPDLADRIVGGWNVLTGNADHDDVVGHGTQVAGVVAAASNNGIGVTGVTWDCPILAVRVGDDDGFATSRDIAAGILWAAANGAKVINVSFAPLWSNTIVRSAAQQAFNRGAMVVISAGNGGGSTRSRGFLEALFVGAVDESGEIAAFSDHGPFVDLVAPGTSIRTTSIGSAYSRATGTSFAAPIVSGAAALAWSVNPELRPTTIVDVLLTAAVDLGAGARDDLYGEGLVDLTAAIEAASQRIYVADVSPPTIRVLSPGDGDTLTGRTTISVSARDAWGIADVVMSVDGVPFATDARSSYRFLLSADSVADGAHELSFVATDLSGNQSAPASITVEVAGSRRGAGSALPGIDFDSPAPGSRAEAETLIRATVTAAAGLAFVEWRVDGVAVFAAPAGGASAEVSYLWRTADAPPGRHTITLVVTDASGKTASADLDLVVP